MEEKKYTAKEVAEYIKAYADVRDSKEKLTRGRATLNSSLEDRSSKNLKEAVKNLEKMFPLDVRKELNKKTKRKLHTLEGEFIRTENFDNGLDDYKRIVSE